jgi:hypothetical protein
MARDYPEYNAALEERRAERITQRLKELDQMRPAYLEAKEAVQGRTDRDDVVALAQLLKSHQAGDSGEKAIFIVAQAAMLVNKMVMPFALVRNYEEKEKEVEKLRK